ncbi:PIR protein [Plasmodium yoelii]|uniref:PIR protein n=2 Tax=Plasmodium yoelii TaxID=5861 RepID=A0AAE9WU38_PLAYO|nr:PIR protein [Plasmodium yoelii]WBY58986.1 PIR protein [Plasmodium yoelii yoelii]CDU19183.1 YIR protein [Plasmodium yoelii]VTZ79818.1 PIR protein [Plasmodium yoelii]|eukprot:XP_022812537.1 PIR protein [Plasmodium yoelii]
MAISNVCQKFDNFRKLFRDELKDSKEYDFNNGAFKKYCPNNNCDGDINKINAGCLWLFNSMFGTGGYSFDTKYYKNETVCIVIWLGYILNLKSHGGINTLNDFYSKHIINNTEYTDQKIYNQKHKSYKDVMDEIKEYMNINISHMSKFYELLKLLCNLNTTYTSNNNSKISEDAKKFADEYQTNFDDDNNNDGNSYNKVLLVLSKYYDNIGKGRKFDNTEINLPTLPTQKISKTVDVEGSNRTKTDESSSETDQTINVMTPLSSNSALSDSSLISKLVPILSIFVAIAIFFGISYKYSLFGFRKRAQKQHLREKLKK